MHNRRDWLKKAIALSATLPLGAVISEQLMAAPVGESERRFMLSGNPVPVTLRLGSNENPYGPSTRVRRALAAATAEANRYPFQTVSAFKAMLAEKEGVTPDHILVGAGSSDLLCATGSAFGVEGGAIVSSNPTFPMLMQFATVFSCRWDQVPLNEQLETDYDRMAGAISADTRLMFVCNPNNPTGTLVDPASVMAFCETVSARVPVFADEAYLEYLEPEQQLSMVDLVRKGRDIIVSRTFSKIYGLAGQRIGYIVGKPDLIRKVARHHGGIPTNQMGLAAARAALGDQAYVDMTRRKNTEARNILTDFLDRKNIFYGKSHTNFVFFDARMDGHALLRLLADKGIAIRVWDYKDIAWCRVSVGTPDEMKSFVRTLSTLV